MVGGSGYKVSNFEEQNTKYSSKLLSRDKAYFEKKRLSDNVLNLEDKNRMDDDVIKEIYERKEKNRKGHNISVTTNNSTSSQLTSTNKKTPQSYG